MDKIKNRTYLPTAAVDGAVISGHFGVQTHFLSQFLACSRYDSARTVIRELAGGSVLGSNIKTFSVEGAILLWMDYIRKPRRSETQGVNITGCAITENSNSNKKRSPHMA